MVMMMEEEEERRQDDCAVSVSGLHTQEPSHVAMNDARLLRMQVLDGLTRCMEDGPDLLRHGQDGGHAGKSVCLCMP